MGIYAKIGETLLTNESLKDYINSPIDQQLVDLAKKFFDCSVYNEKSLLAEQIVFELWNIWERKSNLNDFLTNLREIESVAKILDAQYRDHLVHTVNVYLLGLYLLCNAEVLRSSIRINGLFLDKWSFIATCHDLAYPLEILSGQIERYLSNVTQKSGKLKMSFSLDNLDQFMMKDNQETIMYKMQQFLSQKGINIDMETKFKAKLKEGRIDHGIFGGLLLAKIFRRYSSISEVSTAVALHNITPGAKVGIDQHPLAFLLILVDELQEWDRKSSGRFEIPASGYDISFAGNRIIVKMAMEKEQCEEKLKTIASKISFGDLELQILPVV